MLRSLLYNATTDIRTEEDSALFYPWVLSVNLKPHFNVFVVTLTRNHFPESPHTHTDTQTVTHTRAHAHAHARFCAPH